MKIKTRVCDVCGDEIPKQVMCSLERYQVKIKRISQYNSWGETDLPIRVKVDLCPDCFTNLCKGVI